ncbi:MAG TPA: hypothetical protein VMW29_03730 [Candidatus Bathyarchaeia archaeon]|nr:hypothetical protein [Candidatus Bathyarchaeia archaeon]
MNFIRTIELIILLLLLPIFLVTWGILNFFDFIKILLHSQEKAKLFLGNCSCGGHVSRGLTNMGKKAECNKCHKVYSVNWF